MSWCQPPSNCWGYSTLDLSAGTYINPEEFFTDPKYALQVPAAPPPPFVQLTSTVSPARNFLPTISQDGHKIAFFSEANLGGLNPGLTIALFVMNADGTGLARIAADLVFSFGSPVSLNSNASRMAFAARTSLGEKGVYVANSDGTGLVNIDSVNTEYAAMSSDGTTVAYSTFPPSPFSSENKKIFAIDSDGRNKRLLVEVCCQNVGGHSVPFITGDGSRIIFAFLRALVTPPTLDFATWRVGVIRTDGTGLVVLNPIINFPATTISDNGSKVAFTSGTNPTNVYLANGDGTGLHILRTVPFTGANPVQFTRDGSRLMYNPQGAIFIINADGTGTPQQITPFLTAAGPSMSGDGRRIVFYSDANLTGENPDRNPEIVLANVP